jgi:tRNA nucleotidyltransferase (CCA-adding enzyme)
VVGATPEQMLNQGFQQVGADFPVFLHPKTHEEYALARTERKSGSGYQGFTCYAAPDVSLEEDLLRRDLTINAMAETAEGDLVDPYNGQKDLQNKILRHVSNAFCEDPLRILRVARFMARFEPMGFQVAEETLGLMSKMVAEGEVSHLVAERVWQETARALSEPSPSSYFKTLQEVGALKVLMPELDALFGVPQRADYHPEVDTGLHALMSLEAATALTPDPECRFAALVHDLGKALTPKDKWPSHHGHEQLGTEPLKALCHRLKVPSDYRALALLASEYHTHFHRAFELKPKTLLKVLRSCDAMRRPERFLKLLIVAKADARGRTGFEHSEYPQSDYFKGLLSCVQNIDISELQKAGFTGKSLGEEIIKLQTSLLADFKTTYLQSQSQQ